MYRAHCRHARLLIPHFLPCPAGAPVAGDDLAVVKHMVRQARRQLSREEAEQARIGRERAEEARARREQQQREKEERERADRERAEK